MKSEQATQSVLIVDDDRNVLEVLDARLSSCGLTVHKADGGRKALQILKTHPIDLVVSDVKMPEMDGMALLSEIIRFPMRLKPSNPEPSTTSKSLSTARC